MLSKNKAKFIKSLQLKKFREESRSFVVEGKKCVLELAASDLKIETLVCTEDFWEEQGRKLEGRVKEKFICKLSELEAVSAFKTTNSALAVAQIRTDEFPKNLSGLTLALDGISDPGNMGTIIRTADWFGFANVLASEDCADFYNPKTIQASMGSFCRVRAHYLDLEKFLKGSGLAVYAGTVNGKNLREFKFEKNCILILGSESHGISPALMPLVGETLRIPGFGKADSLNVSAAAAVFCDNYRRIFS